MLCTHAQPVLRALIDCKREWISIPAIITSTGIDPSAVDAAVTDLRIRGYLDVWPKEPEPVVTLSRWGAYELDFRLVEEGKRFPVRRWVRGRDSIDPPRRPRRDPRDQLAERVEALVDPGPSPDQVVIELEEAEARADRARIRRERKRLERLGVAGELLGRPALCEAHPLWPWFPPSRGNDLSGPCLQCRGRRDNRFLRWCGDCRMRRLEEVERARCPGCRGEYLSRWRYCVGCQRWGWSDLFRTFEARARA